MNSALELSNSIQTTTMKFGSPEHYELLRKHNPNLPARSFGEVGGVDLRPRDDPRHRNILDIEDIDRPIYRIMSIDCLLKGLQTNELTLTRIRRWNDPFEAFLLRAKGRLPTGELVSLSGIHDQYFGQCWTLNEDSDAMWRIYSPKTDAVKIRTTPRKLFDSIYDTSESAAPIKFFLGLVRYLPGEQIARIMENSDVVNALLFDNTGVTQVRTILTKRLMSFTFLA